MPSRYVESKTPWLAKLRDVKRRCYLAGYSASIERASGEFMTTDVLHSSRDLKSPTTAADTQNLAGLRKRHPEVDRRSGLALRDFKHEYLRAGKPVVITDAIDAWPAASLWTMKFFKEKYGDAQVRIYHYDSRAEFSADRARTVALAEHIDNVTQHDWRAYPYYLRDDWKLIHDTPELKTQFKNLPYFFDWFRVLPPFMRMPYPRLFIGPEGAITPLHIDVWRTHAWLSQIVGRKRWILFSPEQEPLLHGCKVRVDQPDLSAHPLYEKANPVETTIGPGDTIFVPSGWAHCVVSLDPTLSLTGNYMGPGCFASCIPNIYKTFIADRIRSTRSAHAA